MGRQKESFSHLLISLFRYFASYLLYPYPRFLYEARGEVIRVSFKVEDLVDARVEDHLHANRTRQMRRVKPTAFDADPMVGSLNDGILLGVKPPAQLVALSGVDVLCLSDAAYFETMGQLDRSAVIARGENPSVLHDDGTDVPSETGGPLGNNGRNLHEVGAPVGSFRIHWQSFE